MNKSYFIMSKFNTADFAGIQHLEAANEQDAIDYMVECYGENWESDYMLFEGKQVFN